MNQLTLAARIKTFRKSLFQTQQQFAHALRIKSLSVCLWETGKCEPSPAALIAMGNLAAFHVLADESIFFYERAGIDLVAFRCIATGLPLPKVRRLEAPFTFGKLLAHPDFMERMTEILRFAQEQFFAELIKEWK